jgi:hypothetical protein
LLLFSQDTDFTDVTNESDSESLSEEDSIVIQLEDVQLQDIDPDEFDIIEIDLDQLGINEEDVALALAHAHGGGDDILHRASYGHPFSHSSAEMIIGR